MLKIFTTYNVGVKEKTRQHLWFGEGFFVGYTIDGKEGENLILERGKTYLFNIETPGHPFYFTNSDTGGSAIRNQEEDKIYGPLPMQNGLFTITITNDFPDNLFYQCSVHEKMGGQINIGFGTEIVFVMKTIGFTGLQLWKKITINYDENMEILWRKFISETNFENLSSPGFYVGKKIEPDVKDYPEFAIYDGKEKAWWGLEAGNIADYVHGKITTINAKHNLEIETELNKLREESRKSGSNINFNKEIFVRVTRGFTGESFWKKINVNYDENMKKLWKEFIIKTNFENLLSPGFYVGKKIPNLFDYPTFAIYDGKQKIWRGIEASAIVDYVFEKITEIIDVKTTRDIEKKVNELYKNYRIESTNIQFVKLGKTIDQKQKFVLKINLNNNESIICDKKTKDPICNHSFQFKFIKAWFEYQKQSQDFICPTCNILQKYEK